MLKYFSPEHIKMSVYSFVIGSVVLVLNLESSLSRDRRWWQNILECLWFYFVAFISASLLTLFIDLDNPATVGLIGLCCYAQKPIRNIIFRFLEVCGADPLGALERLKNIFRR